MPGPLIAAAISPLAGRWGDQIGHRWILTAGCAVCGLGYLSYLLLLDEEAATWTRYVPMSIPIGAGIGATIAIFSAAGLADVPPAKFGTANATIRTTQQVCYALGISVVVAILADVSSAATLSSFRWAWAFIGVCYLGAAATVALTFPAGSSDDRARSSSP